MTDKKIQTRKNLIKIVQKLKRQGKIIVTFSGSFDIIHIGHIRSLNEAKKQGDILIILLNSDDSIKSYKGPNRPINSQKDRADFLAAFKCVDYVVIFDEINPKKILSDIKPNIHCNGSDWGKDCLERALVENQGGRIHILKWTKNFSTSNLIKKITKTNSRPPLKAVFLDAGGTINKTDIQAFHKLSKDYKFFLIDKTNYRYLTTKMLRRAVKDFGISLNDSWVIGDNENDVIIGREVNAKTIKIGKKLPSELKLKPNYYAADLGRAVDIILR